MAKSNKYNCKVVQDGTRWSAQITRRKTSKETIVSRSQDGFATQEQAREWGETELKNFMKSLKERNKRRNEKRA